jgi:hypothetical protein
MGYLVKRALGEQSVFALDVRYSGGAAWNCTSDDGCGPHAVVANTADEMALDGAIASVDVFPEPNTDGFDATYFVWCTLGSGSDTDSRNRAKRNMVVSTISPITEEAHGTDVRSHRHRHR